MRSINYLLRAAAILSVCLTFAIASNASGPSGSMEGTVSPAASCQDVKILTRGQGSLLPKQYRSAIVEAGPNQKLVAALAMSRLTDLGCKAVEGIAFVNVILPQGAKALVNSKTPDLIIVSAARGFASETDLDVKFTVFTGENSAERARNKLAADLRIWPETVQAIMHEAGHNVTYLIDSVTEGSTVEKAWEPGATAAAKEAVQRTRLKGGFLKEWKRVNEGFQDNGLGGEYDASRLQDSSLEPPNGFFTNYAGKNAEEDIAETASWIAFLPFQENLRLVDISTLDLGYYPDLRLAFPSKTACESLRATDKVGIAGNLAAVYTKAYFLVDLGIVRESDLESCIGNGKIGLKRTGSAPGFEVYRDTNWKIINEYRQGLSMIRRDDSIWIGAKNVITKNGKTHPAILELVIRIEDDGYPRGLYKINRCAGFLPSSLQKLVPDADAAFHLTVQGVKSNSFCAFTALVLVTRAKVGILEGAVVLQRLVKFSFPPVQEKPEPPVQYTFLVN